jgi:thioredoxin 1
MTELNNTNFMNEIELSDKLCVIDLYADWCGPCRRLAPIMEELEAEYKGKAVKFCKVNVDKEPALAEMFGVKSIPLVAFVKDNTFVDYSEGLVPKAVLAQIIDKNL